MTGRKLGNYLLLEEVGRGGMGSVYKAKDLRLDRVVAVKVLTRDLIDETSRRRFLLEAKAVSALNDPGIVTLHDVGTDDDVEYLVMEYVEGVTLTGLIPPGGLPVQVALQYAERIARALTAAHAVGIVHRDLKPGNVMVKPSGELKVLDFGVAKLSATQELDDQTRTAMTKVGLAIGTPSYMSPEQSLGEAVDHRSDIFSLGVMLYEMLAGKRPYSGRNTVALIHSIHYDDPPPIEPAPPASVSALVKQALEKDPASRYPTMDAFASAIRRALEELDASSSSTHPPDSRPQEARQLSRAGIAAGLALFGAVSAVVWFYPGKPAGKTTLAGVNGDRPAHQLVLESRKLMDRADVPANVEKAISILRAAVEGHPAHAASHASLALALLRSNGGNPGEDALLEAQEHAGRAVSLDPQLALAHVARGGYFYAVRKLPDAERELAEAVKLDPGNGPAHLLLGILYYRMGNFERSRQEYQDAVRLLPDDFEARSGLAALHYHRGDYKEAERESLQAVKLAPDSPRPHQMLGSMYYAQGRLEEAVREYQAALEMQPSASAYSNLGTVYFFREMYTQAAVAFEKATTLQPDKYLYWGNLADAYRWIPDGRGKSHAAYDRAIALARAELKNNPADLEKRSRLAVLLAKRGDRPAAVQEIQRVEQNRGEKTGPLYYRIGIANELIGDRDKALGSLALAIQANYAIDEIRLDPELAALRNDERYVRLTAKAAVK
jgi:eukaryotic-like serine/threonine-protein kinase